MDSQRTPVKHVENTLGHLSSQCLEEIESLRREIYNWCLLNTARKEFVPYEWLSELLTEESIRDALEALDDRIIDRYQCPQIARDVRKFGLRTFAIFLTMKRPDLFYRFFQTDQFDKDTGNFLDKRLPMEDANLKHTLGLTSIQNEIDRLLEIANKKGQVLDSNPKFKGLKKQEEECIGQGGTAGPGVADPPSGGFGKVNKETLPRQRYEYKACTLKQGVVIVRKDLKSQGKEAYREELRCLRLLAAARHPSLLDLYGSYTHQARHNFLFREAVQGDLHDLLEREQRLSKFQHDDAFYLAFCSLASVLEHVHCYANDDLGLEMVGCHHDLKPRNVFVDDGRFILGDFGLSTMKDRGDDPKILAQDRDMYFAAPENTDYVQGTRGQDFGGMIMVMKGFHDGRGNLNPATINHLDRMEEAVQVETKDKQRPVPELSLIQLVRDMLKIDELARPNIKQVLQHLRSITLQKKSEPICDELLVSPHPENVEFIIERQVFREWLGRLEEAGQRGQLYLPSDAAFDQACKTLDTLLEELRLLAQDDLEFPLFSQLRRLNEQLLSCLDVNGRLSIRRAVERSTIPIARKLARESKLPDTSLSDTTLLG
ncbi:hypothetical protein ONZ43_g4970 [Nemania bipapillata]|uniref:Uncharacterized protein n=1 Tax=Nemania bipapillata TaxID=110536 RepID=A0ACC2IG47_9PEZI|nr:hypothetical protein ONZ43_g4970 [Nemania bipapillata]